MNANPVIDLVALYVFGLGFLSFAIYCVYRVLKMAHDEDPGCLDPRHWLCKNPWYNKVNVGSVTIVTECRSILAVQRELGHCGANPMTILQHVQKAEQKRRAIFGAQYTSNKAYRGVPYGKIVNARPVHKHLTYRGVDYNNWPNRPFGVFFLSAYTDN